MSNRPKSEKLFSEAKEHLVGGVNSPVRAYRDYDFAPPFIARALGSRIWDVDGNEYIDYVGSWGPAILGHAHPKVVEAIRAAAEKGATYGAPTGQETELARLVKEAFSSIELVRFVSSGTEAAMSAIRVARGFTGRDKIIKFAGCYHGHADHLLVKAGSGAASHGAPDSAGVPEDFARHTLIAEYNDISSVEKLFDKYASDIAAIIVEPVAGNMGCVPPKDGFLKNLREICDKHKALLIFDEVITGFRVAFGGAQELYGIKPDLTCLGKILGGGLPMGAYGGRKDIMVKLSPIGPVYQAGTLSGNPLAVAAGIAALHTLAGRFPKDNTRGVSPGKPSRTDSGQQPAVCGTVYDKLEATTKQLTTGMGEILAKHQIPHTISRVGSMFSIFFEKREDFDNYFIHMLDNGVYFAPSPFESAFVSLAHTEADIQETLEVLNDLC